MIVLEGIITQLPPQSARVEDLVFMSRFEHNTGLEAALAQRAHATMRNHTVYKAEKTGMPPIYYMFSDGWVRIGLKLVEGW